MATRLARASHHDVLGIKHDATDVEIRKAYLRLALKHHPDKAGNIELFRSISEAYLALCKANCRATHVAHHYSHPINTIIFLTKALRSCTRHFSKTLGAI